MKVLVLSDIHGNIEALNAVLNQVSNYDEVLVLGDLVDYGPDPDEIIDLIKGINAKVIKGNHDEAVVKGTDCRAGKYLHDVSIYTRENITLKKLGRPDIRWLSGLPYEENVSIGSLKGVAVHASVKDRLYKYLYPWLSDDVFRDYIEINNVDIVLVGHTHFQFIRPTSFKVKVVNPGSVGQPRDGDWRAAYALIDEDKILMGRVKYNVEATLKKLRRLVPIRDYYVKLHEVLTAAK